MNKLTRQQIINYLVNCVGYSRSEFNGLTRMDILEAYIETFNLYRPCMEYSLVSQY